MNLDDLFPNPLPIKRYRAEDEKPKVTYRPVSIAALSWAAERAGKSYGQYVIGLSAADQHRIQIEFDAWKAEQARAREERRAAKKRVANTTDLIPEGYILTDNDL